MSSVTALRSFCLASICVLFLTYAPSVHAWTALEDGLDRLLIRVGLWAAGLEEKSLELSPGCSVVYYDNQNTQASETLVLLHGFSANKNLWIRFATSLKQYRLLIPDLAGHGQSCYIESVAHTIPYQVEFVHRWLHALGVTPVHIAGNSMGGWIGAYYASTYPDDLKTLALMDAGGVIPPVQSAFMQARARGDNVFFFNDMAGYDRLTQMAMVTPPTLPALVKNAHLRAYLALQPRFRKMFADITDTDGFARSQLVDERLASIRQPTLIVWGKQDQIVDVSMAAVYANGIASHETVLLDGVGHVPMVEQAELTAEHYRQFIDKQHLEKPH